MTAEIAVMNKSAVALAADSAVTISGGGTSKIYNGAEKLFALTKYHPVGIMVYGTGSLCNVPWELVIKEYRKQLQNKSFDTLDGYAEDFWNFLCKEERIIPMDLRENSLTQTYLQAYDYLFSLADDAAVKFVEEQDRKPNVEESIEIISSSCSVLIESFDESDFYNGFDQAFLEELSANGIKQVKAITEAKHPEIDFPDELIQKISQLFATISCKQNGHSVDTGVVFAGYGEKEYFPVVLAYNVHGFVGDKLKYSPDPGKSAAAGASGLQAYAQDDEVITFMSGVNPYLEQVISDAYKQSIGESLHKAFELLEQAYEDQPKQLSDIRAALLEHANQSWDQASKNIQLHKRQEHVDKVLQMIEFLPKQDLAYMAESLVNMTAFKRKVSNDSETVGGPIDVAIISKGDGFIWVKRKHYFDKELNSHYFNNFLQGAGHDQ
ncbi:hypothetical protein [Photobacterium sp. J15]|uniref:hypothetical protein n=1 Tax=Photobacterium sp. J15 TaxID=265901 RepID=UPI0007E3493F|nr:hypothetical protein [Photobacterium sp. J15]